MKKLVLASNNPGKLREFAATARHRSISKCCRSRHFNVPEAEEPHLTFVENALAKARHAARLTGLPALADDSGLCVERAGRRARRAIRRATPANRSRTSATTQKLIADLAGQGRPPRPLRLPCWCWCAMPTIRSRSIAEGEWHGEIIDTPRGAGGFGYDPYFLVPDLGLTAAELAARGEEPRSHRGKALAQLIERLRARR